MDMLKRWLWFVLVMFALIGVAATAGGILFMRGGISSRADPGQFETAMARRLRSMAIPGSARRHANPIPTSAEAFDNGLAHFADHCASCHANDGSGQTAMGRNLYPKAPDMREPATQDLSDGELFYIIENGVKLTGMPAWGDGTPEGTTANWHLVHFIRRLSQLTEEDLERMKAMNPKSPEERSHEEHGGHE